MKRTYIIFYLFNLFASLFVVKNCPGQIGQKSMADSIETWVSKINLEYNNINNDSAKFKVTEQDIFRHSAEGGELSKYYDGNTLRKAVLILYGETGQSNNAFYLLNGEIILIYKKSEKYNMSIHMGIPEVKSREENKFYFKNGQLIRWIGNDGKKVDSSQYADKEDELNSLIKIIY